MKKQQHLGWCVTIGKGNFAYVMDDRLFRYKRDALEYRKQQCPCPWSKDWHITKLYGET